MYHRHANTQSTHCHQTRHDTDEIQAVAGRSSPTVIRTRNVPHFQFQHIDDKHQMFRRHGPMRQSASGADWRAMRTAVAAASAARPDLASRGRGCGNRLRRNTRHENNRNSECTSEARRDAVGASETRINTRLFTYGVRARGCVAG